ncbi:MAG: hypothetical protein COU47_01410 [Candidatus Niyogibacteria bacterium CG10_big_fil_rev_8_21_14_0_10_46_36]|uniref:Uncharacterized protein n=1 Tax=Candidatus Niyogibacteria bacterium CG10_big_fil_rev_8_21_14_0_10_46_36 TaxID=1974726 RepID=A0A2H0TFK5_9BACT|nr:MAG: hypothetical protein COU47_01410 [Candidatus Niyogibacteria bacterium CG10_big_fil_rev_8_21_14_0_10_46_36]
MKRISSKEFEEHVGKDLYSKGLDQQKRNILESAFLGDKDEGKITQREAEQTLKHIEKNRHKLNLSEDDIKKFREVLDRRMR